MSGNSVVPDTTHDSAIADELARYRARRTQRYSSVNVLLLAWEEDDIGVDREVKELANLLRADFGYFVWPYHIPSVDSQSKLNLKVAQFADLYGNDIDALIIVYYSGHGGRTINKMSSACVWAAKITGGPTVDWSHIQPTFLGARSDVLILLDCCFAGQAVRPHLSNTVELLAATDKDQFTPTGRVAGRPSFTAVLMQQLALARRQTGSILVSELQTRMLAKECGLDKQPYYTKLAENQAGTGLRLSKWSPTEDFTPKSARPRKEVTSMYLRLSLFQPLSEEKRNLLLRWLTKDSPAVIEDIELAQQTVSDAKAIGKLGDRILQQSYTSAQIAPHALNRTRGEGIRLIEALNESLVLPNTCQFDTINFTQIMEDIRRNSRDLLTFLKDNLATIDDQGLEALRAQEGPVFQDLRSRIEMRLFLIQDEVPIEAIKVYFERPVPVEQKRAVGKKAEQSVLVEYWCYEPSDRHITNLATQAARVSALLSEKKDKFFRILLGLGYTHETVRKRFGFVYQLPEGIGDGDFWALSDIIRKVKYVPLEIRKRLASAICDAVLHLHSIGWYHKEIKSGNILIFRKLVDSEENSKAITCYDVENPYIVGFDCSRPSQAETWASEDHSGAQGNLYRHPVRWGKPKRFERHHDIYALGIILLEIGLWRLLPDMDGSGQGFENVKKPSKLRDTMLAITQTKLAHSIGSEYSEAVKLCLSDGDWEKMEPWEAQRTMRVQVWQAISERGKETRTTSACY